MIRSSRSFFFFGLLIYAIVPTYSQELLVNTQLFDLRNGLSDRTVNCVVQDDRGLIWAGTNNGLNRFDGNTFSLVEDENGQLSSGEVMGIKKDRHGRFWIQKRLRPLIVFDPETQLQLAPHQTIPGLPLGNYELLMRNGQNPLFFFKHETGKIFCLNPEGHLIPFENLPDSTTISLVPTSWGTVLANKPYHSRIDEFDNQGKVIRSFPIQSFNMNLFDQGDNFLQTSVGTGPTRKLLHDLLFFIEKTGAPAPVFFKKDGKPLELEATKVSRSIYIRMVKDSKENFWVNIDSALMLFDRYGNLKKDLTKDLLEMSRMGWKSNHIFVDDHDRVWVCTGLGVFLITVTENPFRQYLAGEENLSIRGITELKNNRIFAGTYGGTKIFDKGSGKVLATFPDYALNITRDKTGTIWAGTHGRKLMIFDEVNTALQLKIIDLNFNLNVLTPYFDQKSGILYVGTNNGLYLSEDGGESFRRYNQLNQYPEINQHEINFFHRNRDGIWMASTNGLYLLDEKEGITGHFEFPNNFIKHFHEDTSGNFWLATGGGGLIYWKRKDNTVEQFTTKEGLFHNVIYAVYEDRNGFLWLPSNNGLMRFDKNTRDVVVFQPEDGITHTEFNTYAHFQASDGRLYFGGLNGITAFYPDKVAPIENDAPFIVTQLQQFDSKTGQLQDKTRDFLAHGNITLHPGDKFFMLDFALLDYSAKEHTYAWKIEGLDKDWNYQTSNSLRINFLRYGRSMLHIKAKGEGGQWAKQELHIPIITLKPFYLRWPFLLTLALVFISGIFLAVRWRFRWLRRKALLLEKVIAERTAELAIINQELEALNRNKDRLLAIIAHDLRSPLVTLGGLAKKVTFLIRRNRIQEIEVLGNTVEQAIDSVYKLLDNLLNWSLVQGSRFPHQPELIDTAALIEEIRLIYHYVALAKNIEICSCAKNNTTVFADRSAMHTILRNLVDNAIKFTPENGRVEINASTDNGSTRILVKDTGIGIDPEKLGHLFEINMNKSETGTKGEKGTGLGLVLCKDLAAMNGGSLEVKSEPGAGSAFTLVLPAQAPSF